jgi:hypothetical protein
MVGGENDVRDDSGVVRCGKDGEGEGVPRHPEILLSG